MSEGQSITEIGGHGGHRPGAGRKPKASLTDEKSNAYLLYAKAKAQREAYAAKTAELELKKLTGEMVRVDDVVRVLDQAVRVCRESILGVPARMADLLAAESDARTVERMLDTELRAALIQLAKAAADGFGS